jgi:hypothetical protein
MQSMNKVLKSNYGFLHNIFLEETLTQFVGSVTDKWPANIVFSRRINIGYKN